METSINSNQLSHFQIFGLILNGEISFLSIVFCIFGDFSFLKVAALGSDRVVQCPHLLQLVVYICKAWFRSQRLHLSQLYLRNVLLHLWSVAWTIFFYLFLNHRLIEVHQIAVVFKVEKFVNVSRCLFRKDSWSVLGYHFWHTFWFSNRNGWSLLFLFN